MARRRRPSRAPRPPARGRARGRRPRRRAPPRRGRRARPRASAARGRGDGRARAPGAPPPAQPTACSIRVDDHWCGSIAAGTGRLHCAGGSARPDEEEAPVDPSAIELRYRYHRARRQARVRAKEETRLARYRFYIVDGRAARDRDRIRRRQLARDPAALRHLAGGFAHTAHHADARADGAAARPRRPVRGRPRAAAAGFRATGASGSPGSPASSSPSRPSPTGTPAARPTG